MRVSESRLSPKVEPTNVPEVEPEGGAHKRAVEENGRAVGVFLKLRAHAGQGGVQGVLGAPGVLLGILSGKDAEDENIVVQFLPVRAASIAERLVCKPILRLPATPVPMLPPTIDGDAVYVVLVETVALQVVGEKHVVEKDIHPVVVHIFGQRTELDFRQGDEPGLPDD